MATPAPTTETSPVAVSGRTCSSGEARVLRCARSGHEHPPPSASPPMVTARSSEEAKTPSPTPTVSSTTTTTPASCSSSSSSGCAISNIFTSMLSGLTLGGALPGETKKPAASLSSSSLTVSPSTSSSSSPAVTPIPGATPTLASWGASSSGSGSSSSGSVHRRVRTDSDAEGVLVVGTDGIPSGSPPMGTRALSMTSVSECHSGTPVYSYAPTLPTAFETLALDDVKEGGAPTSAGAGVGDKVPASLGLQELVMFLANELQSEKPSMDNVRAAMQRYAVELNEWKRYEFWDPSKKYTRNLIATDNETFTLMLLCWNPGKGSPIHDHAGSECFMRAVAGKINEVQYAWADRGKESEQLRITKTTQIQNPDVAYITDAIGLHRVENGTPDERAVTLHCYLPPYQSCKCFLDGTGKSCPVQVTFHSEHGKLVTYNCS